MAAYIQYKQRKTVNNYKELRDQRLSYRLYHQALTQIVVVISCKLMAKQHKGPHVMLRFCCEVACALCKWQLLYFV